MWGFSVFMVYNSLVNKKHLIPTFPLTKKCIELHQQGFSTYKIAEELGIKQNSVYVRLKYWGVAREALGINIEKEVAVWFKEKGFDVERQRGDAPFDLKINGLNYDVKSAKLSINNNKSRAKCFRFLLADKRSSGHLKDFVKLGIDYFLLVFKVDKFPMYLIRSEDLKGKQGLNIKSSIESKYNLVFVGNLRGGS